MKIAILGSRGIPNAYGGFEQCAEILSQELVARRNEITVYSPHFHSYQEKTYRGVDIVHKWCPERRFGSAAHFIYDYLCLRDAVTKEFDVILELGYQSASIGYYFSRMGQSKLFTNMDGLEWKRAKWSPFVRRITCWLEKLAATRSHYLIADNPGIQCYLKETYGRDSFMIPYGAEVVTHVDEAQLNRWALQQYGYFLIIARLEPENNLEPVLDGYVLSGNKTPFIVVGNQRTRYGEYLEDRYAGSAIQFLGGIYDKSQLDVLRWYAKIYFHGHSVGGTNPSLLEAMAASALICAHDNQFNRAVLEDDAAYFDSADEVAKIIRNQDQWAEKREAFVCRNLKRIEETYSWPRVADQYLEAFMEGVNADSSAYPR